MRRMRYVSVRDFAGSTLTVVAWRRGVGTAVEVLESAQARDGKRLAAPAAAAAAARLQGGGGGGGDRALAADVAGDVAAIPAAEITLCLHADGRPVCLGEGAFGTVRRRQQTASSTTLLDLLFFNESFNSL